MLELETVRGVRVVASAGALDAARWSEDSVVLRLAPDDAVAIGAVGIEVDDEDAIVVDESGFVGAWLTPEEVSGRVVPHIEWPLPDERPALAQGFIAGVPAKLWLTEDRALLLCPAAYAHELTERLR